MPALIVKSSKEKTPAQKLIAQNKRCLQRIAHWKLTHADGNVSDEYSDVDTDEQGWDIPESVSRKTAIELKQCPPQSTEQS